MVIHLTNHQQCDRERRRVMVSMEGSLTPTPGTTGSNSNNESEEHMTMRLLDPSINICNQRVDNTTTVQQQTGYEVGNGMSPQQSKNRNLSSIISNTTISSIRIMSLEKIKQQSFLMGLMMGFLIECTALGIHVTVLQLYSDVYFVQNPYTTGIIFFLWSCLSSLAPFELAARLRKLILLTHNVPQQLLQNPGKSTPRVRFHATSSDRSMDSTIITSTLPASSIQQQTQAQLMQKLQLIQRQQQNYLEEMLGHMECRFGLGALLGISVASASVDVLVGLTTGYAPFSCVTGCVIAIGCLLLQKRMDQKNWVIWGSIIHHLRVSTMSRRRRQRIHRAAYVSMSSSPNMDV